ncbi:hypothetical protein [Fredinandcohnia sp. 179-A 10B2 NHS]|uniref:hypothetical protein n=1 Tax=Fredinandcohnia sp. 179-A 10B2 NHS TaxID=3235176 RepID=UPI0039A3A8A0
MSINSNFIDALRLFDMANKLFEHQIALNDGEMITLRSIYQQLSSSEKDFVASKYGESLDFLENYEGVRKRKG